MPPTAGSEFRQSWRIVLAGWIGAIFGQNGFAYASFSVFVEPLAKAFGCEIPAISAWVTFYFLGNTVASPLIGILADRIGARKVLTFAIPSFALMWVLASQMIPQLWLFYTVAFIAGAVATGASPMVYQRIVNTWYTAGRGTALGIMSSGIGLSYSLSRIVQHTVDRHGWRIGFLLVSLGCLIPWILTLLWLHERREGAHLGKLPAAAAVPIQPEAGYAVREALGMPAFWLMGGAMILYGLGAGGATANMVPFLTSTGLSRETAASYYALLGLFSIAGRVITGIVIDRVHAAAVCCAVLIIEAAAFLLFANTGGQFARIAISATGFAFGGEVCCIGYLVARYFGLKHFGTILGLLTIVSSLGVALGPLLFSLMRQYSGTYVVPFTIAAGIATGAALCFGILRMYPFFKAPPTA